MTNLDEYNSKQKGKERDLLILFVCLLIIGNWFSFSFFFFYRLMNWFGLIFDRLPKLIRKTKANRRPIYFAGGS